MNCLREMLIYFVLSFPSPINLFGDRLRRENEAKGRCFEERPASHTKRWFPAFAGKKNKSASP